MSSDQLVVNALTILLGSSVIGGVVAGIFKMRENRTTLRVGFEISESQRNARWNAAYRAAAEAHLKADSKRDQNIYELRAVVNHLLDRLNEPPQQFTPLDDLPPLFPKIDETS